MLPGWPRISANYVSSPPALADVDGDGLDEIFIGENDHRMHAYRADGSILPGWPVNIQSLGSQDRHTPAIADVDGDGALDIVFASGQAGENVYLFAHRADGESLPGFPVNFAGYPHTFPTIGDVNGDDALEIVLLGRGFIAVIAADGTIERRIQGGGGPYGGAPALADLDRDGIPEIVVQNDGILDVHRGDGSRLPGWPQFFAPTQWQGNSAPVVGDVDGDGQPEIVVTTQSPGRSDRGQVWVFKRNGVLHPRFPKTIAIGAGAVPAIADIDQDGRNEIIITGSFWDGRIGNYDKVWVYDLGGPPHGRIEWGQFGGGPRHQGRYVAPDEDGADPCK